MSKENLQSLFCGILFCISIAALIIACLAFVKNGKGEYYSTIGVGGSGGSVGKPMACVPLKGYECTQGEYQGECCQVPGYPKVTCPSGNEPRTSCPGGACVLGFSSCGTSSKYAGSLATTWQAGPPCCSSSTDMVTCKDRDNLGYPPGYHMGNAPCATKPQIQWAMKNTPDNVPENECVCTNAHQSWGRTGGGRPDGNLAGGGDVCKIRAPQIRAGFPAPSDNAGNYYEPPGNCAKVG